jgi:hypothetical protein
MTSHLLAAGMGMTAILALDRAMDGRRLWAGIYAAFTLVDAVLLANILRT